jgi:YD repeat-containing protein
LHPAFTLFNRLLALPDRLSAVLRQPPLARDAARLGVESLEDRALPSSPSVTSLWSSVTGTAGYGGPVTFTALVAPDGGSGTPTGSVDFYDGAAWLDTETLDGSGYATYPTSLLGPGTHSITAYYLGDTTFDPSNSSAVTQEVRASSSTTLGTSTSGMSVTLTATVDGISYAGTPGGTVTFKDGSTTIGTGTLSGGTATYTVTTLSSGSHSYTAVYGGSGTYSGSTSSAEVVATTSTSVSSSVTGTAGYGDSVTFTATVTAAGSGSGTPGGTVDFYDGASWLGSGSVDGSGQATYSTNLLDPGTHSISASYGGDDHHTVSSSSSLTQEVRAATSTTLGTSTSGMSVTLTATVDGIIYSGTPTGTVTFKDGSTTLGTGTLSGGVATYTVTTLSTGSHSYTAVYGGSGTYSGSTSSAEVAATTTTSVSSSVTGTAAYGEEVTFTATVTPAGSGSGTPGGYVDFYDDSTFLGSASVNESGQATYSTSSLAPGTRSITAHYLGDDHHTISTSSSLTQEVRAATATTLGTSTSGMSVTLTATVDSMSYGGTPTGTVTFKDGSTTLGTGTLSGGVATYTITTLSAGSHPFTAAYGGSGTYSGSTSSAEVVATTATSVSSSVTGTAVYGESVTFTATVTAAGSGSGTPGGYVDFYDGSTYLGSGSVEGGQATYSTSTLSPGTRSITAHYLGDDHHTISESSPLTQEVRAATSTTLETSVNPSVWNQSVTLTATVGSMSYGGTPTGTVTFKDGSTTIGTGTLSGGVATLSISTLEVGSHTLNVYYGGDGNYSASDGSTSQTVDKADTSTTLDTSVNPTVWGQATTLTATVSPAYGGTPTGTVTFKDGTTVIGTASLSGGVATLSVSALEVGSHTLHAYYNGDSHYNTSCGSTSQTVNKAATTVSVASDSTADTIEREVVRLSAAVIPSSPGAGTPTGTVAFTLSSTVGGVTTTKDLGTATVGAFDATAGGFMASLLTAAARAGTYTVTATYSGDDHFLGSYDTLPFTVAPSPAYATTDVCIVGPFAGAPGAGGTGPSGKGAGGVYLASGAVQVTIPGLSSSGPGGSFGQGLIWTSSPAASGGSLASGMAATQAPRLAQANGLNSIALVSGQSVRFFDLYDGAYHARPGDTAALTHDPVAHTFTATDGAGNTFVFADFDSSVPDAKQGQLIGMTLAGGASTGVTSWDSAGRPLEVRQSSGSTVVSYLYGYVASGANEGLLETATLRQSADGGSTWATVQSVAYTYYDGSTSHGSAKSLKYAEVKDAGGVTVDQAYYRYAKPGSGVGSGSGDLMTYSFGAAGAYARLTAALGSGVDALTGAQVAPYADLALTYDGQDRVVGAVEAAAGCSVCSGGAGAFSYSYEANPAAGLFGYNAWQTKTVETLPDGNTNTAYLNGYGQVMLSVYTDAATEQEWATYSRYDDEGRLILRASPSAVSGYDDSYADLAHFVDGNAEYLRDSEGLIQVYEYGAATTATGGTAGDALGYLKETDLLHGETAAATPQQSLAYVKNTVGGVDYFHLASSTVYRNDDGTGGLTTAYSYTFLSGTNQLASVTVTLPAVATGPTGSGAATSATAVYDSLGRPVWTRDAAGFLTYTQYDAATGAVVQVIADVDTTQTTTFADLPSGWATPSGGGLHLTTTFEVDAQGRTTKVTYPNGRVDYTVYNDAAHEVRMYVGWDTSAHAPTGPTTVYRQDLSWGYSETLTMSASPALDGSNRPTGGEAVSKVQSLSRSYTNGAGQVVYTDAYFNLGGLDYSASASLGSEGVNFYRTRFQYDNHGLLNKTVSPEGTIYRSVYDGQGRLVSEWVGTDDTPTTGYWSPSNLAGTNMVKVREYEYDGGGVGDGNMTKVTEFTGVGAARVTQAWYDWRGRAVATKAGVEDFELSHRDDFSGTSAITWTDPNTGADWVQSGGVYSQTSTAEGDPKKAVATGPEWPADMEVTARVRVDSWDDGDYARAGVGVRTDTETGAGYNLVFHGTDQVQFLNDGVAWGNSYSFEWEVGAWYTFKLRVEGSTLLGKVWAVGEAEPAEWMFEQTGWTDRTGGAPALNGGSSLTDNGSATASFDDVEVRTATVGVGTTNRPITYAQYDNLGQVVSSEVYDGDGVLVTVTDGVPGRPDAELLRAKTTTLYDNLGRVYRTETYSVDPSDGSVGAYTLKSDTWYDARGLTIKTASPGGLVQKFEYDGAGRLLVSYLTDGADDADYGDASDVSDDNVLEQVEYQYDESGNVLSTTTRQRFHDETETGALGDSETGPYARVSYAAYYYGLADRLVATLDAGTNGGDPWSRPSSAPTSSPTELVTGYGYSTDAVQTVWLTGEPTGGTFTLSFGGDTTDAIAYDASASTVQDELEGLASVGAGKVFVAAGAFGGWEVRFTGDLAGKYQSQITGNAAGLTGGGPAFVLAATVSLGGDAGQAAEVIDPAGRVHRTYSDALGRTVRSIENFVDGVVSDADDKTVGYAYNGIGMTSLTAFMTGGGGQTTQYVYGVSQGSGSEIDSNDIVGATRWPDASTGVADAGEEEVATVDALGQTLTQTDRNGNVHALTYDVLGRVVKDAVTTLGSGVDGSVRRIETAYDGQGNAYLITSYDDAISGSVVNQVKREFNGLGQLVAEWQEHGGEVDGSTPVVEYTYSEMPSGANHSRLTKITYASGYELNFNYSSGLDANIGRLSSLSDSTGTLETYQYLGLSTVVIRSHPQPDLALTLVGSPGDGGDQYAGLDRFGRVVDQKWEVDSAAVSQYQYGYDLLGNRLWRDDLVLRPS